MKVCGSCKIEKDESEFYRNGTALRFNCKPCHNNNVKGNVSRWRRNKKLRLVDAHGSKCVDCGLVYPPFVMQFDHRDPSEKSFPISNGGRTISYERMYEESLKCDLVCANCHAVRTHKQRCDNTECEYCRSVGPTVGESG